MLTPLELLKEINLNEKKVFSNNINELGGFKYLDKAHQDKDDLSKLECFLELLNNLSNKDENFAEYYINQITNFSFTEHLFVHDSIKYDELNIFFRAICNTFLFKKDMSIISSRKELEKLLNNSNLMSPFNLFNRTNYTVINIYLAPLDILVLYHELDSSLNILRISIQNLYKDVLKQITKERNYHKFLLEKEEELKQINLGNILHEKLKEQKIVLNQKNKQEKVAIQEKHNKEILKLKSEKNVLELDIQNKEKAARDLQNKVNQLQSSKLKHGEQVKRITALEEQLEEQKQKSDSLLKENESLKESLSEANMKEITFKDWLHFTMIELKSNNSNLSESELELAKQVMKDLTIVSNEPKEQKVIEVKEEIKTELEESEDKITYMIQKSTKQKFLEVFIDENGFPVDKDGQEILNISNKMLLRKNDLVLVDEDYNLKYLFGYKMPSFVDREKPYYILRHRYGKFYNADDELVTDVHFKHSFTFENGQLVVFYENGDFLANTEKYLLTLETIKEVTDRRKNKIFIVSKKIDTFLIVINPETKKESILNLDNINEFDRVNTNTTVITDEDEKTILYSFLSPLFYKLSPYYDKRFLGVVKTKNDLPYVRDITDEDIEENYHLLSTQYSPRFVFIDGSIVWYDEDYNFLYKEKSNSKINDYKENPNTNRKSVKKSENKVDLPDITERILIVGNPSNRISYQIGFRKFGIDAITVDGYDSYSTIKREMKNIDKVIFLVNFASHDNQAKIKLEKDIDVYYPKKDGINYIYNEVYSKQN